MKIWCSTMNPSKVTSKVALDAASQLHRSTMRLVRLLVNAKGVKGMTLSKLGVLGRLYRDGAATATELAAYMRIQPQSLTRLISDLERRKLISRRQNDADRRQSLLEITELGSQLLIKDVTAQRLALAQNILKILTPAEQEMLRISAGLIDRLADAAQVLTSEPQRQQKKETKRN